MRKTRRGALAALLFAAIASCGISRAQQAQRPPVTAPRPVPNLIAPAPQPHRPSAQRQPGPGTIMGYVYWDASVIKHSPLNSCDGLSVTVDAGSGSLGTFSAGHFAYIPNVGTLGVCAYAVNQMPVGADLQVLVNVTNAAAFSPAALPGGGAVSINIMGGTDICNNLPPTVPSPTDLTQGHSWTCPNYAYNVNFILVRAPGSLGSRVAGPVRVAPGAAVTLSPQPYPPKNATLLGSGEQKTLLGDGSVRPSPAGTLGPSQTMSAQGQASPATGALRQPTNVAAPATPPGGNRYSLQANSRMSICNFESLNGQALTEITAVDGKAAAQMPFAVGSTPGVPINGVVFSGGATFTPGNHYIIQGCGFGSTPGHIFIESNAFNVILIPQTWSDERIDAEVDPSAQGVAQPVVLVVLTAGKTEVAQFGAGVGEATAFGFAFAPNGSTQADVMGPQGNSSSNSGPAAVPSKAPRKNEYEAITVDRGVTQDKAFTNWAKSARVPVGIRQNPNVYVAQACAKDPSFRILFISGTSDGKTLTVGPQYTIWGCSFGNRPAAKRPAPPVISPSQSQVASYPSYYNVSVWASPLAQSIIDVDANIVSWSDNAVVVTFPARPTNHSGPSTAGVVIPAQVLLTRGDGQTRIFGGEGGVFFSFIN